MCTGPSANEKKMEEAKKAEEAEEVQELFAQCTKEKPFMWHNIEIVGGEYHTYFPDVICKKFQELKEKEQKFKPQHQCKYIKIKYTHIDDLVDSYGSVTKGVKMPVFTATWKWSDAMKYDCEGFPDVFLHTDIQQHYRHSNITIKRLCHDKYNSKDRLSNILSDVAISTIQETQYKYLCNKN